MFHKIMFDGANFHSINEKYKAYSLPFVESAQICKTHSASYIELN